MRRLALIIAALLLFAGCSNSTDDETTTTPVAAVTTTTAAATTTTVAETTTTVADTTTESTIADEETTTTSASMANEFKTVDGTAPASFDSYTATMSITMALENTDLTVTANGIWTTDAFQCTMSSDMGGVAFNESIIATPETLWYDQGNGYEPASLFNTSASDIISSCPAAPTFWAEFAANDLAGVTGDEVTFNGRSAYKADLSEMTSALSDLGFAGIDTEFLKAMTVWLDIDTGTVIGLNAQLEMPPELMQGLTENSIPMTMEFSLDNVNDPTLSIDIP
jgi:hypothetical protein